MLYTEDFTMCHYVGFSQIGSHIHNIMTIALLSYTRLNERWWEPHVHLWIIRQNLSIQENMMDQLAYKIFFINKVNAISVCIVNKNNG